MGVLSAFEACARLGNFTKAAAELSLTQSAISRQIRALEDLLGQKLFVRERQTVCLNAMGEAYAHEVREALQRIASATLGVRANPLGGTLHLAILPTFGTRWLAPRLPRFVATNPGITINLMTRLAPFDFQLDVADAAIHYGTAKWSGAELDFLMPETVVPACSKRLQDRYGFRKPADLSAAPLLHLTSRANAWGHWFKAHGVPPPPAQGILVDQFAMATQAAMGDLGVALLPRFLFQGEFERGDLVEALNAPLQTEEAYYLACPVARRNYPPLHTFRQWLRTEAEEERRLTGATGAPLLQTPAAC